MPIVFEPPAALLAAQSAGSLGSPGDGSGVAPNGGSQVWIAASPANGSGLWGGCQVWLSFDGASYGQIGTITARANQGVLTAPLAAPPGANPDTADTLAVDLAMSGGQLPTGSDADAQASRTLCYVDGELIAYGLATPTTGTAYTLTDLYRGLYGATGGAHASGGDFVLLDDSIFKYNLPSGYAGAPLYFKFASFNAWGGGVEDLSTLTAVTYTPAGGIVPSGVITGGDASVSAAGVVSLAATGVAAGSYTLADLTVDAKGRVTAASSGSVSVPSGANPTAAVGLAAVNGSATTFMRSDAAPAIDQTMSPTWTGAHTFANAGGMTILNNSNGDQIVTTPSSLTMTLYAFAPAIATKRADGTKASPAAVAANESLQNIVASGYDGGAFVNCGETTFLVAGTVGGGIVPTLWRVATMNSSGALKIGLTVDAAQNINVGPLGTVKIADNTGTLYLTKSTVSALPSAATAGAGARRFVTDATATTFASAVAGGGANGVPVYSDGTAWRIG